jgi:aspartate/methionine/tyrosine aminotransferase
MIEFAKRLDSIEEYYFSKKAKEIAKVKETSKTIINFSIGNPDLPPAAEVVEFLYSSAKNKNNHGYQSYSGLPELRTAFSKWYSDVFKVELNPQNEILPLIGSKEGIFHIAMTFINPGEIALIPNPSYAPYNVTVSLAGGNPIFYDLSEQNNWKPDLSSISEEVAKKAKIMWINYPNMPTGAVIRKDEFLEIVEFAKKYEIILCNDNPYSLVLPQENPTSILSLVEKNDYVLELNSLSKSHNMAGWRVGLIAGNSVLLDGILKFMSNVNTGIFKPIQEAAAFAITNITSEWHAERNAIYKKRRDLIFEITDLLKLSTQKNGSGMFVWAKVDDKIENVDEFVDFLLWEYGIVLTPGRIFGSNGSRFVRFSLGIKEHEIENALEIVKQNQNAILERFSL